MMNREIIVTKDGSSSISIPVLRWDESERYQYVVLVRAGAAEMWRRLGAPADATL